MKQKLYFLFMLIMTTLVLASCSETKVAETQKVEETIKEVETTKEAVEASAPVLSNEIFKIDVPAKFDGLYDTEVNDHTINLYDKEQKAKGNPGWIFGIQVFENVADWATGPTEKVGEITIDGKQYDVIISYPTESQYGFSDDGTLLDMPEKYKSMYDARYEIASTVSGKNGETMVVGAGKNGDDLYKEVLNKYLKAVKETWDSSKLESEKMSTMYSDIYSDGDGLSTIGYMYKDINIDGIDELLIGEIADGDLKGVVYDIYTMVDRKPKHVVSGWDRNRYFILDSGLIRNEYSDSADESGINIYDLTKNSTELFLQVAFKYDESADEKNPWFKSSGTGKDDKPNWDKIKEDEYNELDKRFSKKADINYKPLSTLN